MSEPDFEREEFEQNMRMKRIANNTVSPVRIPILSHKLFKTGVEVQNPKKISANKLQDFLKKQTIKIRKVKKKPADNNWLHPSAVSGLDSHSSKNPNIGQLRYDKEQVTSIARRANDESAKRSVLLNELLGSMMEQNPESADVIQLI